MLDIDIIPDLVRSDRLDHVSLKQPWKEGNAISKKQSPPHTRLHLELEWDSGDIYCYVLDTWLLVTLSGFLSIIALDVCKMPPKGSNDINARPNVNDDDDYVAQLLAQDAKNSSLKYSALGLQAYMPKR